MRTAPMTEDRARDVCKWRYPSPYEIYDMRPWERVLEEGWALGLRETRERETKAVLDSTGDLAAYPHPSEHHDRWMLGSGPGVFVRM